MVFATFAAIVAGAMIRGYMALLLQRPSQNVFSDIAGYVAIAGRLLDPSHDLNAYDLIQPIGTGALLAAVIKTTGNLQAADWLWFMMSSVVPVLWFFAARHLAGMGIAVAVAWMSALDVSHASFSALFMSETPFTLLVAAGAACLARALGSPSPDSVRWSAAAGTLWGLGLLFRGHALAILFMLFTCVAWLVIKKRDTRQIRAALVCFMMVTVLASTYFSLKTGRFMVTSTAVASQTLMGRLPDSAEAKFEVVAERIQHFYGSPVAHQRGATKRYYFPFGVIENGAAMREVIRRFVGDPIQFIALSLRNANDTITGNDPWPANQLRTIHWLRIFESLFAVFALIPACALILQPGKSSLPVAILALPVAGIWLIGLLTIGETRYRVPFDGMIFILACMRWRDSFAALSHPEAKATHPFPVISQKYPST